MKLIFCQSGNVWWHFMQMKSLLLTYKFNGFIEKIL